jgi:hypothetical protein
MTGIVEQLEERAARAQTPKSRDFYRSVKAEIERLRAALKECANDLESELNGHYQGTLDYPSQQCKFERDMEPVVAARKLLAAG